jgi:hypothetical protein
VVGGASGLSVGLLELRRGRALIVRRLRRHRRDCSPGIGGVVALRGSRWGREAVSVVAIRTRRGRPLIVRCSGSPSRDRSPKSIKDFGSLRIRAPSPVTGSRSTPELPRGQPAHPARGADPGAGCGAAGSRRRGGWAADVAQTTGRGASSVVELSVGSRGGERCGDTDAPRSAPECAGLGVALAGPLAPTRPGSGVAALPATSRASRATAASRAPARDDRSPRTRGRPRRWLWCCGLQERGGRAVDTSGGGHVGRRRTCSTPRVSPRRHRRRRQRRQRPPSVSCSRAPPRLGRRRPGCG